MSETKTQPPLFNRPLCDFLQGEKIPHLSVYIDGKMKKKYKETSDDKYKYFIKGQPVGWNKNMSYDDMIKFNKDNPKHQRFHRNAYNVKIRNSGFMVIDLDYVETLSPEENKILLNKNLDKYGRYNITYSVGSKYPHLWRRTHPDDWCSDKTNYDIGVDLRFENIFESQDGMMENIKDDLVFDSGRRKTEKPKPKKKVKKIKLTAKMTKNMDIQISNEDREVLENIDIKYIDSYGDWLKMIWGIYSEYESLELCDWFSQRGTKYKSMEDVKYWIEKDRRREITWGTVCYYSKTSNKDNYLEIKRKHRPDFINGTDKGFALFFLEIEGDNIINDRGNLYICDNPYWKPINLKKGTLIKFISETLDDVVQTLRKKAYKSLEFADNEQEEDKIRGLIGLYDDLKKIIGSYNKLKNISLLVVSLVPEKEYSINKIKPYYFCFKNCAFDLETRKNVEVEKYDYITTNTGYDYVEPTEEQIKYMNDMINKIIPNDELKSCVLSILKCGIIGKLVEKFVLFNGSGRNGKGVILAYFKALAGLYCSDSSTTLLTEQRRSGANPEMVNLEYKRSAIMSEPSDGSKIDSGIMKELTGNQTFSARQLYGETREFDNMLMLIMECNDRPSISGRKDNAILDRMVDVPFTQTFGNDEDRIKNDENYHRLNTELKSDELIKGHRCAFFKILMDLSCMDIYEPKIVKMRTKKFLLDSDDLMNWIDENYDFFPENSKKKVKMLDIYDNFRKSDYYRLMDAKQRRKWGKLNFQENVRNNIQLRDYFTTIKKVYYLTNYEQKSNCLI